MWRIPKGGPAERWVEDPLLEGTGAFGFPFPIGANGIAFRHDRLIVSNSEQGLLLDIPVEADGSAGEPRVLAEDPALVGADGIALDVHGGIHVATGVANTVVRLGADGSIDTLADKDDGLNLPATLAFGTGRSDRQTLFVTNLAIASQEPSPAILTLPVGAPGQPLP